MKVIEVQRDEIPQDWTEAHVDMLRNGHQRGVVSAQTNKSEAIAKKVLGFASAREVGLSVFAGLTFVDLSPGGGEAVQFRIVD